MNNLMKVYELIDLSSENEEKSVRERASTPNRASVARDIQPNFRVVLEMINSSVEAVADEEEYFDIPADSLEAICKRMRLYSTCESLESEELPSTSSKSGYGGIERKP